MASPADPFEITDDPVPADPQPARRAVTSTAHLEGLNEEQRKAVVHADGPLLVLAGAIVAGNRARAYDATILKVLGATRARIVLQFLAESVLTSAIAGVLGVLLAIWGLDLLKKVAENFLPRVQEISLDVNVLLFAVGLSLITGIILGLVPALHASRSDPIDSLKDSSRGSTGRQAGRLRAGLLVAPAWRRVVRAQPRAIAEAEQSDGHALEGEVDVHAFAPADLRSLLREAGFEDRRVGGEELLANAWGWGLRTVESSAEPESISWGWRRFALRSYMALQKVDSSLLEPYLPAELFYNLLVSARKPA